MVAEKFFDFVQASADFMQAAHRSTALKRFSPGLNRGIPKRLAVMESFVH
jgi:hypothetical protein